MRLVDMGESPPIGKRTLEEFLERLIRLERTVERLETSLAEPRPVKVSQEAPAGDWSKTEST